MPDATHSVHLVVSKVCAFRSCMDISFSDPQGIGNIQKNEGVHTPKHREQTADVHTLDETFTGNITLNRSL